MYFQHANAKPLKHTFRCCKNNNNKKKTIKPKEAKIASKLKSAQRVSQVFHINLKQLAPRMGTPIPLTPANSSPSPRSYS